MTIQVLSSPSVKKLGEAFPFMPEQSIKELKERLLAGRGLERFAVYHPDAETDNRVTVRKSGRSVTFVSVGDTYKATLGVEDVGEICGTRQIRYHLAIAGWGSWIEAGWK